MDRWLQAALDAPLAPGSRVLVGSSGAARNGSPLSGGSSRRLGGAGSSFTRPTVRASRGSL